MVIFAFHQYLASNFHLNNFLAGNYISVLFATWNDVSLYFVSNISQFIPVFTFMWIFMLCKKKATIFHIYGIKTLHIKPSD